MIRWIILAVIVVVLSCAITVAIQLYPASMSNASVSSAKPIGLGTLNEVPGAKPKAEIDQKLTYDFGTLPQQTTGKNTWHVKNVGNADLELAMLHATCSCTLAKFKNGEKAVVKPGESTEITLEFETRANNGDYKKGATIGTNDPTMPEFELWAQGKVYPAVMTYPPGELVNMMSISNDLEDHLANVAIFSKDRPAMKVLKIATSKHIVTSHVPLTTQEAKELKVENGEKVVLNVKPTLPLGVFREEVVITTDHPQQPEVRLVVTGRMSGPINLLPDRLTMHQVDGKNGGKGELIISVRGSRETKFTEIITPKDKNLKVEITPTDKKGRYLLSVSVPPGTSAQSIESEIVIKTDHPKADKLIVPIDILIQDGR